MEAYLKYYEKCKPNACTEGSGNVYSSKAKIEPNTPRFSVNSDENSGKLYITRNDLYADPVFFYYEAEDVDEDLIGHDWIQVKGTLNAQKEKHDSDDSDEEPYIPGAYKNRPGCLQLSPGIIIAEKFPTMDANVKLVARGLRQDSAIYKWEFFYTNFLLYLLEFVKCHRQYMLVIKELSLQEQKYVEYIIACLENKEYISILDFDNCWQANILIYIRMYNCYSLRVNYSSGPSNALLSIVKTANAWTYVVLPEKLDKKDQDLITRKPPPKTPLPLPRPLVRPFQINPMLNTNIFNNLIEDLNNRDLRYLRIRAMEHFSINGNTLKCCLLNLNLINLSIIDVTIEVSKEATFFPNVLVPILIVPARKVPFHPFLVTRIVNYTNNPSLVANVKNPTPLNPNANIFVSNIRASNPITNEMQSNLTKAASEPNIPRHFAPRHFTNNVANLYSPNGQRPEFNVNMRPPNPNLMRPPTDPPVTFCQYRAHNVYPIHFNTGPQVYYPNVARPQVMNYNAYAHDMYIHNTAYFPHPYMPQAGAPYPNIGGPPPMTFPTYPPAHFGMIPQRPPYYSTVNPNFQPNSMMPARPPMNPADQTPPPNRPYNSNYQFNSMGVPGQLPMNPPSFMPATCPFNPACPPDPRFPPVYPMNQPNPQPPAYPINMTYPGNSTSHTNTTVGAPVQPINPNATTMPNSTPPANAAMRPPTNNQIAKSQQPNLTTPSSNFTVPDVNGNVLNRLPPGGVVPFDLPMVPVPVEMDNILAVLVNPDVMNYLTMNPHLMDPMSTNSNKMGLTVVKSDITPEMKSEIIAEIKPEVKSSPDLTPVSVDLMSPPTTLSSIRSPSTTGTNDSPAMSEGASISPATKSMSLTKEVGHIKNKLSTAKTEKESLTKQEGGMVKEVSNLAEKSVSTTGRATTATKKVSNEKSFITKVEDCTEKSSAKNEANLVSTTWALHTKKSEMKTDDANATLKLEEKAESKDSSLNMNLPAKNETNAAKDLVSDSKEASSVTEGNGKIEPLSKKLGLNVERKPRWNSIINVSFGENYFKGKRKLFGAKYNEKVINIVQSFMKFASNDAYKEFMFLGPFEAKESEAICIFISLYVKNTVKYGDMYKDLEYFLNCHRREAKESYTVVDCADLNYVSYMSFLTSTVSQLQKILS